MVQAGGTKVAGLGSCFLVCDADSRRERQRVDNRRERTRERADRRERAVCISGGRGETVPD